MLKITKVTGLDERVKNINAGRISGKDMEARYFDKLLNKKLPEIYGEDALRYFVGMKKNIRNMTLREFILYILSLDSFRDITTKNGDNIAISIWREIVLPFCRDAEYTVLKYYCGQYNKLWFTAPGFRRISSYNPVRGNFNLGKIGIITISEAVSFMKDYFGINPGKDFILKDEEKPLAFYLWNIPVGKIDEHIRNFFRPLLKDI